METVSICLNEVSQLTMVGKKIGVDVRTTSKTYYEIAGEGGGIEYGWANTKNSYRNFPLRVKKSKESLHTQLKLSFK